VTNHHIMAESVGQRLRLTTKTNNVLHYLFLDKLTSFLSFSTSGVVAVG